MLLLCSHSPNDVFPEPQRNVSIAAVRGAVRPSSEYCNEIAIMSKSSKPPVVLEHSQAGLRLELNTFSARQLANSTDKAALLICFIHRIVVRSVGYLPG